MKICEIYECIIGEGSFIGYPGVIIRLTGCNLRCSWCDTKFAFEEGKDFTLKSIYHKLQKYKRDIILVTGGEPLYQKDTPILISELLNRNYKVLLETNGSFDITVIDNRCVKIVDCKLPNSGMMDKMRWNNFEKINSIDEVKFVIADRNDYNTARKIATEYKLTSQTDKVYISPVSTMLDIRQCIEWILSDNIPFRLNIQLHKMIYGDKRGV